MQVQILITFINIDAHNMNVHREVVVECHLFLASEIEGGYSFVSRPNCFTCGETALSTHFTGSWVEHRAGLGIVSKKKRLAPAEVRASDLPAVVWSL